MYEQLKVTLSILMELNDKCKLNKGIEIINKAEFEEQLDNLNDYSIMVNEMNLILDNLKNNTELSFSATESELHKLHIKFTDTIWHVNEVHELVKKMIGKFPI
ncbi:MAG: hypothetical protein K6T94_09745 [Paenibacillus sp.]|nr:hypothetical protein [Paenibacillus sp.]